MEENKDLYSFTFVPVFYTDMKQLDYEMRCKVMDAICCYGATREIPKEIEGDTLVQTLMMNAKRMIDGQDKYKEQQKEMGATHKTRAVITDEEIIGAYFELKQETGHEPSEKEVIKKSGKNVQRIAARSIWQNRLKYWNEYVSKGCITIHDTVYRYTKETIHTSDNTYNYTNNDTSIHTTIQSDDATNPSKVLFDF